jgi:hypothetical protein
MGTVPFVRELFKEEAFCAGFLIDVFSFGNVTPSCKALTFLLIYLL